MTSETWSWILCSCRSKNIEAILPIFYYIGHLLDKEKSDFRTPESEQHCLILWADGWDICLCLPATRHEHLPRMTTPCLAYDPPKRQCGTFGYNLIVWVQNKQYPWHVYLFCSMTSRSSNVAINTAIDIALNIAMDVAINANDTCIDCYIRDWLCQNNLLLFACSEQAVLASISWLLLFSQRWTNPGLTDNKSNVKVPIICSLKHRMLATFRLTSKISVAPSLKIILIQ